MNRNAGWSIHICIWYIMECTTYNFKPENLINATSFNGSPGNSRNKLLTFCNLRLLNLKLKFNFFFSDILFARTTATKYAGRYGKVPSLGNKADIATASRTKTLEASEISTVWTVQDFDAAEGALNYDAFRFGKELPEGTTTSQDKRSYTSAICYNGIHFVISNSIYKKHPNWCPFCVILYVESHVDNPVPFEFQSLTYILYKKTLPTNLAGFKTIYQWNLYYLTNSASLNE